MDRGRAHARRPGRDDALPARGFAGSASADRTAAAQRPPAATAARALPLGDPRAGLAAGLPFADDPTNHETRYARNRIRAEILPLLEQIGPEVERNVAETQAELLEEAELIQQLAERTIREAGCEDGLPIRHEELAVLPAALRRAVLTTLAETAAGGVPVRIGRRRAAEILRLAADPEGGIVELGRRAAGDRRVGHGALQRQPTAAAPGAGAARRFPDGRATATGRSRPSSPTEQAAPAGPELATLDAAELGSEVEIRCWREGDRIRPLGLGGSKSLQDLFTDQGVPRSLRHRLPVLVAGERIAWVAGVAVSEEFRLGSGSQRPAVITARALGSKP